MRDSAPQDRSLNSQRAPLTVGGAVSIPVPGVGAGWNPLLSTDPSDWNRLLDAIGPASLLVLIEGRMSAALAQKASAEDILQESLMQAWRDRASCQWRGVRAFRSWLLTIIDHRIRDLADREHASKRGGGATEFRFGAMGGVSREGCSWGPAGSTTPSRVAMTRERAACMREALQSLPEEYREVVRLRVFEQLNLEVIAIRLGLGVSGVRHRFRKGAELYHRRLRAALATASIRQSQMVPNAATVRPENSASPD
jgi:RNA polymerase sigma factor (sigma-70 family)